MKTLSKILRIATLVLSVAGLVLFFTPFVTYVGNGEELTKVGAELAFGASGLAKSPKIMFCMILSLLSAAGAGFSFSKKSKAGRWVQIVLAAISGIYMLVVALSKPWEFLDMRTETYSAVSNAAYTPFVLVTAIVILASLVSGVAYILVRDAVEAKEGLTIPKKIVKFFREYKGEVKKIVWPGPRSVVKNTLIVLVICAILGIFIWLLDLGLSELIKLITSKVA